MPAGARERAESSQHELVITRAFDAPRSLVWRAWTEPERLVRWMGMQDFSGAVVKMDVRPGGAYRFHLRAPDGTSLWQQGIHLEVVEAQRLVRTCVWADADGNPTGPETIMTIALEDQNGKTKLTFRQVFASAAARDAHREGTDGALDRLAAYLATV
jgi:uncharacterized protein YndB with AHSA1/START domain